MVIAGIVMAMVPVALRIAAHIADNGGMYTREMPTFAIGCIYATFYEKINGLASKYFKSGMIISIAVFVIGFVFYEPSGTYAAAIIIILVSQRFTYYNKVTFFLGKICIGVYLFLHYSSIVMQNFIHNEYLWILTNAGFIIEVAILIYAVQYAIEYAASRTFIFMKEHLKPKNKLI